MERPIRFEHNRLLGDKRTQRVYDLDAYTDPEVIDELMAARDLPVLRAGHAARGPQPGLPARPGPPGRRHGDVAEPPWRSDSRRTGSSSPPTSPGPPMRADVTSVPSVVLAHGYPSDVARPRPRPLGAPRAGRPDRHRDGVAGHGAGLPGLRRVRGQLLAGRVARRPPRGGRPPAAKEQVSGVWLVGFGTGGALCHLRRRRRPDVRGGRRPRRARRLRRLGVAPRRLLEHAREVGMIGDPAFPSDFERWTRELRDLRAVVVRRGARPPPLLVRARERRRPRPGVRRPRPRRRPRRRRAADHERCGPSAPPRSPSGGRAAGWLDREGSRGRSPAAGARCGRSKPAQDPVRDVGGEEGEIGHVDGQAEEADVEEDVDAEVEARRRRRPRGGGGGATPGTMNVASKARVDQVSRCSASACSNNQSGATKRCRSSMRSARRDRGAVLPACPARLRPRREQVADASWSCSNRIPNGARRSARTRPRRTSWPRRPTTAGRTATARRRSRPAAGAGRRS